MLASSNPSADAQRPGFAGCLESLEFNGEAVRREEGSGPRSGRLFGIYQCCSEVKSCASNPCGNGGACVEDFSGGENKISLFLNTNKLLHNFKETINRKIKRILTFESFEYTQDY